MPEVYRITTAQSGTVEEKPKPSGISFLWKHEGSGVKDPLLDEMAETAASDYSFENRLNAKRMLRFRSEFSMRFLQLLREQDFEYGVDTPADELVRKCLNENESITKQWLNELFVKNYADKAVVIGVLRVLSHFEYHEVAPQGSTIALAALANSSAEVRECGMRAFENWSTFESLEVLKNVHCEEKWLNDYRMQVIADLEEELRRNVATC